MQRVSKIANTEEDLMIAFRVFDKDENDCVPVSELSYILTSLDGISLMEVDEVIRYFDRDGDGIVTFDGNIKYLEKLLINPCNKKS